jgi:uncharacterized membrane protein YcaP (DUF421 family)
MFFDDWFGLIRVLVVGVCAYGAIVFLLRVSGKRTLSKMNAFDFIMTVALGSTLANVILSKEVALLEGILAFALLISLQFLITWLEVRSVTARRLAKSEPTLLLHQGQFLWDAMKRERVGEEEILAALRSEGIASVSDVGAVVLETEGTLSVLPAVSTDSASAMKSVTNF